VHRAALRRSQSGYRSLSNRRRFAALSVIARPIMQACLSHLGHRPRDCATQVSPFSPPVPLLKKSHAISDLPRRRENNLQPEGLGEKGENANARNEIRREVGKPCTSADSVWCV